MSRPDPFLNLLKHIGFLPLRRADVQPFSCSISVARSSLFWRDLDEAMNSGAAKLPAIQKEIATAGQIQGARPSMVKASLDILGTCLAP